MSRGDTVARDLYARETAPIMPRAVAMRKPWRGGEGPATFARGRAERAQRCVLMDPRN